MVAHVVSVVRSAVDEVVVVASEKLELPRLDARVVRDREPELGPLAGRSTRRVRINSTCTVFAGAELRERLSLGEKREEILEGLHRAIILLAMSL